MSTKSRRSDASRSYILTVMKTQNLQQSDVGEIVHLPMYKCMLQISKVVYWSRCSGLLLYTYPWASEFTCVTLCPNIILKAWRKIAAVHCILLYACFGILARCSVRRRDQSMNSLVDSKLKSRGDLTMLVITSQTYVNGVLQSLWQALVMIRPWQSIKYWVRIYKRCNTRMILFRRHRHYGRIQIIHVASCGSRGPASESWQHQRALCSI